MNDYNFSYQVNADPYGYESWLVPSDEAVKEGASFDMLLYWGHHMKPYRPKHIENPYVYALTPMGTREKLQLLENSMDYSTYRLNELKKGLYHFVSQETGCFSKDAQGNFLEGSFFENPQAVWATRYFQFAHTAMYASKNASVEPCTKIPLIPLHIVPERWHGIKTGECFAFLLYFKNRPLPLYDIEIIHCSDKNKLTTEKLVTDGHGRIAYTISAPGNYVILASYTSFEKKESLYYDTSYTYTYFISAKNKS